MEKAFVSLNRETERIALIIDSTKMKYIAAGSVRGRPSDVGNELVFDGDVFEDVEEFVYLGLLVTCDNVIFRETKKRAAYMTFYGFCNQLKSNNLHTHVCKNDILQ